MNTRIVSEKSIPEQLYPFLLNASANNRAALTNFLPGLGLSYKENELNVAVADFYNAGLKPNVLGKKKEIMNLVWQL